MNSKTETSPKLLAMDENVTTRGPQDQTRSHASREVTLPLELLPPSRDSDIGRAFVPEHPVAKLGTNAILANVFLRLVLSLPYKTHTCELPHIRASVFIQGTCH